MLQHTSNRTSRIRDLLGKDGANIQMIIADNFLKLKKGMIFPIEG